MSGHAPSGHREPMKIGDFQPSEPLLDVSDLRVAFATPLRDMGIDAAWNGADGAGYASAAERQPAAVPNGSSPLSSHRVVLVQTDQTAVSLCPAR